MGFQANTVICSVKIGICDNDAVAINYIHSVIVPIRFTVDTYTINNNIPALFVLLVPATRILQDNSPDCNITASEEIYVLRTYSLPRAVIPERIAYHTFMYKIDKVTGYLESPAVNYTFTGDPDILLVKGKDQGSPVVIHLIVKGIYRTDKDSPFLEL